MKRQTSLLLTCLTAVTLIAVGQAHAEDVELVNGEPQQVEASVGVTFWVNEHPNLLIDTHGQYMTLDPGDESLLLAGAQIEAPDEIDVKQDSLTVTKQKVEDYSIENGGTRTTYSHEEYRITGKWTITVAKNAPPSTYAIKIQLPAVTALRDKLSAAQPSGETWIEIRAKTFLTAVDRAGPRLLSELLKGLGCLLGMTVCLALIGLAFWGGLSFHGLMLAAMGGLVFWFCGPAFLEFMGRAMADLARLGTLPAVGAAAAINFLYFGLFWFVSGLGRWNRAWSKWLWLGAAFLAIAAAFVFVLPVDIAETLLPSAVRPIADLQATAPQAMLTILPGLLLAGLAASRAKPRAAGRDPRGDDGLAGVCRYLEQLPPAAG